MAEQEIGLPKAWEGWEVTEEIGAGSYGRVYEIQKDGRTEAVKIIDIPQSASEVSSLKMEYPDEKSLKQYYLGMLESFQSETKLMQSLDACENIVSLTGYEMEEKEDEIGYRIFIRMELLQPFSDYQMLHKMDEAAVIQLGLDITNALVFCAGKRIIHRDIKPDNVLVDDHGHYKLCDFGVARNLDRSVGTYSVKGTYTFMSPEVYHGRRYGSTTDIYSLGIMLYRLMNKGRDPFVSMEKQLVSYQDRQNALQKRMDGEQLPPAAQASEAFNEILLHACEYDPEKRYATAAEFREDLLALQQGKYELGKYKTSQQQEKVNNKTNKNKTSIVAASILAIVIGLGIITAALILNPFGTKKELLIEAAETQAPEFTNQEEKEDAEFYLKRLNEGVWDSLRDSDFEAYHALLPQDSQEEFDQLRESYYNESYNREECAILFSYEDEDYGTCYYGEVCRYCVDDPEEVSVVMQVGCWDVALYKDTDGKWCPATITDEQQSALLEAGFYPEEFQKAYQNRRLAHTFDGLLWLSVKDRVPFQGAIRATTSAVWKDEKGNLRAMYNIVNGTDRDIQIIELNDFSLLDESGETVFQSSMDEETVKERLEASEREDWVIEANSNVLYTVQFDKEELKDTIINDDNCWKQNVDFIMDWAG